MVRKRLWLSGWLAWCTAALLLCIPAGGAPEVLFFPIPEFGSGEYIGLSLVNPGVASTLVAITWTSADASVVRTSSIDLPPGSQRAFLLREILSMPVEPPDGWVRVTSSEPGILSYLTTGNDGKMDGTEGVSQTAARILLSHLAVATGFYELDHTDSFAILVNPESRTTAATAELIGLDGRAAGTVALSVPGHASRTLRVSEVFRDVLPPNNLGGRTFAGYMRVSADYGLAAWLRVETPLSRRLIRGRAIDEIVPEPLLIAGHFACGGPLLYRSVLNLVNAGSSPETLELVAQDNGGRTIGKSAQIKLGPGQGIREDVLSLFGVILPAIFPPPLVTGSIRIRAAEGRLFQGIGDVDIHRDGNAAAVLLPISGATSREWTLPFAVSGKDYYTGYALVNPNELLTVQTDVTIEVLNTEGRPTGTPRSVSLSPGARISGLVEKELTSGYLRVRSNLPVALLGIIGQNDGSAMACLPALR